MDENKFVLAQAFIWMYNNLFSFISSNIGM